MTVLCPSGISELGEMLRYAAYEIKGPVAIRYPRGSNDRIISSGPPYEPELLSIAGSKSDTAIISYGRMLENVMDAADLLAEKGINAKVIKLTDISNIPVGKLSELIGNTDNVYVVEECVTGGSVASKLALEFSKRNLKHKITAINIGNETVPSASVDELMKMFALDAGGIAATISTHPK